MRRALICGVSGQDGAYLAGFLLEKGYEVWGTSRDAQAATFDNLSRLGILGRVKTMSMAVKDFRSVLQAISHSDPHEICDHEAGLVGHHRLIHSGHIERSDNIV